MLAQKIEERVGYLRSDENPHGYLHVKKNRAGQYYCFYKGVKSGLHPTPELAVFVLHKLCARANVEIEMEEEEPELAEPYPECDLPVPSYVNLSDIAYLRDTTRRSGYKGVRLLDARGRRTFACKMVHNGEACTTQRYDTPAEAAWALHTRDLVIATEAYVVPEYVAAEKFGMIDVDVIAYLKEPTLATGWHHVRFYEGKYEGHYTVDEIEYLTHRYMFASHAAWAVHHHLVAAKDRRTTQLTKAENQVVPIKVADFISGFHQEYAAKKSAAETKHIMETKKPKEEPRMVVQVFTKGTFKDGKLIDHPDF